MMNRTEPFDANDYISIIEAAAREECIAGSNLCSADDPEPAREAIREAFAIATRAHEELEATHEKHGGVKREYLADPAATLLTTLERIVGEDTEEAAR